MATYPKTTTRPGSITVSVADAGGRNGPIDGAYIGLFAGTLAASAKGKTATIDWTQRIAGGHTGDDGTLRFADLEPGSYSVVYGHQPGVQVQTVDVHAGCDEAACLHVPLRASFAYALEGSDCKPIPCENPRVGDHAVLTADFNGKTTATDTLHIDWPAGARPKSGDPFSARLPFRQAGTRQLQARILLQPLAGTPSTRQAALSFTDEFDVDDAPASTITGGINVAMTRTETEPTSDLKLWGAIRASTEGMRFDAFNAFMDELFCGPNAAGTRPAEKQRLNDLLKRRFLPFTDTDAYRLLKAATEAFVMVNCGVIPVEDGVGGTSEAVGVLADFRAWLDRRDLPRPGAFPRYLEDVEGVRMLPYLAIIRRKLPDVPIGQATPSAGGAEAELCDEFIRDKLRNPCLLELIWSYWHEEAMLVQTMNAVTRRFQNVRGALDPDPLANLEVNPLRPLNNLLWGVIQDEQHRLTVARRNAEYDHHYGLRLEGRAVAGFRGADTRSKFVEAFHHLLRLCTEFYKQDDDTTVKADAFGVLNALKEVHLILSQGAHSQFGDLPATARTEMLMQQWLLARPEFREFLPTRAMVAYPEPWMDRVDAMKKLQGWSDTSVIHFHNLAVFGEQVLLAIRYGAWSTVFEPTQAFNFARFWRPQIQGYIHAYRAATGVELGATAVTQQVDATLPSLLLQRRLAAQRKSA
jgi:hypothetical protein